MAVTSGTLSITNGGQGSSTLIGIASTGLVSVDGTNSRLTGSGSYSMNVAGTLALSNGGQASVGGVDVGYYGSTGSISVDGGGKLTCTNAQLDLVVGSQRDSITNNLSVGSLSITNGGQVACISETYIGRAGGLGRVSVDAANSKLSFASAGLAVGFDRFGNGDAAGLQGDGMLSVTNGGQASCDYDAVIGGAGGTGTLNVNGGTLAVGRSLNVGADYGGTSTLHPGIGLLAVTNAGIVTSTGGSIGGSGGLGTVLLSGANSGWTNSGSENLGDDNGSGFGTLSIGSGAPFKNSGALGVHAGGTILFNGGTVTTGTLNLAGGHVLLSPGHNKVLQTAGLTISSGQIDLADNAMVVDYSGAPGSLGTAIRSDITGNLIISSSADSKYRLGYGDTAITGARTYNGVAVDSSAFVIKYTYLGDVNLDGKVDIADLGILAAHWQQSGVWTDGDEDYSGKIDIADLGSLAANWQAGVSNPLNMSFEQALNVVGLGSAAVPEPAGGALLLLSLLRRRKAG